MKENKNGYYPAGIDLRYQDISHEQERELFARARAGDDLAKEFLIKNHLLYAMIQGRKWSYGRLPDNEVISAANYALILAYKSFDYTRENRFSSYLRPFIRAQIARLFRSLNTMGEHAPTFPNTNGEKIPLRWVSGINGIEIPASEVSLIESHPVEEENHREFLLQLLEQSKETLTEMESEVIRRHFGEESACLSTIGEEKGLTRARIHQIKDSALKKLRRAMEKRMKAKGIKRT